MEDILNFLQIMVANNFGNIIRNVTIAGIFMGSILIWDRYLRRKKKRKEDTNNINDISTWLIEQFSRDIHGWFDSITYDISMVDSLYFEDFKKNYIHAVSTKFFDFVINHDSINKRVPKKLESYLSITNIETILENIIDKDMQLYIHLEDEYLSIWKDKITEMDHLEAEQAQVIADIGDIGYAERNSNHLNKYVDSGTYHDMDNIESQISDDELEEIV